jgi:type I restriction enzyme S subunit
VLKNLWLALPPVDEQQRIIRNIDSETRGLSDALSRANWEIELMREYQACLIVSVVTGQLDVRHVDGALPDETDECLQSDNVQVDDSDDEHESEE